MEQTRQLQSLTYRELCNKFMAVNKEHLRLLSENNLLPVEKHTYEKCRDELREVIAELQLRHSRGEKWVTDRI